MTIPFRRPPTVTLANAVLTARISPLGAELQSLVSAWGGEVMWRADPAVWGGPAPNLFPIVGALAGDSLLHRGVRTPMPAHGFLRHSLTEVVARSAEAVAFRLTDSAATWAHYPFAFALTVAFRLVDDRLEQTFTVANPADQPLLVSLGAHPGFRWPLADHLERAAHRLVFAKPEPQPIRRVSGGGLGAERWPTPVRGRVLALTDDLFAISALVWDRLHSASVTYGVAGAMGIEMTFADFPHFGLWSKPGAGFVCLEPWQGHISPQGFDGELADKPGIVAIAPGASRAWSLTIRPVRRLPGSWFQPIRRDSSTSSANGVDR
jgi:galactose mutarotase-like enzyme